jgi:hypothetical protein
MPPSASTAVLTGAVLGTDMYPQGEYEEKKTIAYKFGGDTPPLNYRCGGGRGRIGTSWTKEL